MHTELNLFSYILSGAAGLLAGSPFAFKLCLPRSKAGLITTIIIGMLSPWIMTGGWAFCATIRGENYGIQIGTMLGAICAILIVGYAVRAARSKEVAAGA